MRLDRPLLLLAVATLMLAGPACAQTLGRATGPDIAWWRVLAALLLCLALAVGGALALRARLAAGGSIPKAPWRFGTSAARRLRVVEAIRVGSQTEICLIACDETEYLVAVSPQKIEVLAQPSKREA